MIPESETDADADAAGAPSRRLVEEARQGFFRSLRVEHIPYGVPLDAFQPIERDVARRALGLPLDRPVLVLAAVSLADRRKGGAVSRDALGIYRGPPLILVTLGHGQLEIDLPDIEVRSLGYVQNERMLSLAYSAADVHVHPALADNLPNTVLEAMACGTPTAALPVGGLPDMVRPGVTGWPAATASPQALAEAIGTAVVDVAAGRDLRAGCRAVAEQEYSPEFQAAKYMTLFAQLCSTA